LHDDRNSSMSQSDMNAATKHVAAVAAQAFFAIHSSITQAAYT